MVVRRWIWLFLPLAVCASQSILCAQQFGHAERELSIVEVENVVQDEPAVDLLEWVEPDQDSESQLESSAVEDLVETGVGNEIGKPVSDADSSPVAASEDAVGRPQEEKSDAQRRSETRREQLAKLRRPLKDAGFNGLEPVTAAKSGAGMFDASAYDSKGHDSKGHESRWITSTVAGDEVQITEVTHYARRRLYFEDSSLERCGQSDGYFRPGIWTNGKSAAKFLIDTTLLPYRMLRQRPDQLVSARAK